MFDEQALSLEDRVALHAALADPARLAIVDALVWGDRSPSELQRQLGLPSNLMAHHLKALEAAGLVTRHRSEGDRRRTYLRLVREALNGVHPLPADAGDAARIVFVCTANSARSQLAAALWRRSSIVPAASAGTHPAERAAPGAVAAARRHHLPLRPHRPRAFHDVATVDDLLVTVCDNAHEELTDRTTLHWSVPDPVAVGTDAAFDAAFDEITSRIAGLAPLLTPHPSSTEEHT